MRPEVLFEERDRVVEVARAVQELAAEPKLFARRRDPRGHQAVAMRDVLEGACGIARPSTDAIRRGIAVAPREDRVAALRRREQEGLRPEGSAQCDDDAFVRCEAQATWIDLGRGAIRVGREDEAAAPR